MKYTTMIGVLLLACVSVQAQEKTPQHEIAVSYGYPTIAFAMNVDSDPNCPSFLGGTFENDRDFGPLSLEYYYRVSPLVSVGGAFTYIKRKKDIYQWMHHSGDHTENYYAVMPSLRLNWARAKHFCLYSKVALGAYLNVTTDKGVDIGINRVLDEVDNAVLPSTVVDKTKLRVYPIGQLSPLGIEVGDRLRVFGELGIGIQGVYYGGLRYRF